MFEEVRCKLVELLGVVGSKGKNNKVVDGLTSSLIYSQGGDCCESDSKLEKLDFWKCKFGARTRPFSGRI